MKYILNTSRYAIAFTIVKNDREVKIPLDVKRLYRDTGNIATSGITPVEDEDFEELKKQSRFNQMIEKGELTLLEEDEVKSPEESKIKTLEKENEDLRQQLEKSEKADVKEIKKENKELERANKELEKANADLKAQLEALSKSSVSEKAQDKEDKETVDTSGF